ncbi:MAG: TAT-variant-translocated molybdopterin oxidoreductase, partial [Myxococcota bacterium]|nr:TAT-variant-translocated molybdopterin oxidoreductase [Myxococcota bacterium]
GPGGKTYWRSLDELACTPQFQEQLAREFPPGASELSTPLSRRSFMHLMGASLALSGLAACRRPVEKILPYTKAPEYGVIGLPLYYATTMTLGQEAVGLLVESNDGRPTKIEGNPAHPMSGGASSAFAQAAILELYDPDRSTHPVVEGKAYRDGERERGYEAALRVLRERRARLAAVQGAGLHVLSGALVSPTLLRLREQLLLALPKARWHVWEPLGDDAIRAGSRLAFSDDLHAHYHLDRADVVLVLDADPLGLDADALHLAGDFAERRRPEDPDDTMSRLYVVEPSWTITGTMADHRLRVRPSEVGGLLLRLGAELARRGLVLPGEIAQALASVRAGEGHERFVAAVAKDLLAARGRAVIIAGRNQPREVHALVHALNAALDAPGKTVEYIRQLDAGRPLQVESMRELAQALGSGAVDTLVVLGGNPLYDAPADLALAERLRGGQTMLVHLGLYADETAAAAQVHIPRAHFLEAWGDARATDGTVSVVQPLIAPLYGGWSDLELVSVLVSGQLRRGHDLVRETWRAAGIAGVSGGKDGAPAGPAPAAGGAPDRGAAPSELDVLFELAWRKVLRDGLLAGSAAAPTVPVLQAAAIGAALPALAQGPSTGLEIVFCPSHATYDGRFANNGWLQELPDPITKLTWDNAALLSVRTARQLGVEQDDMVRIRVRGRSLEAAVCVQPGQADGVVTIALGYGRRTTGRIGAGAGFDAYRLRDSAALGFDTGVTVEKLGRKYDDPRDLRGFDLDNARDGTWLDWLRVTGLVRAQDHFSQQEDEKWNMNRTYRSPGGAKKEEGKGLARTADHHAVQGRALIREADLAEFRKKPDFAQHMVHHPPLKSLWEERKKTGQQWGMAIDLSVCTGCSACVVACQAENNIPIVGKAQVRKGREMHWLRVDRYFSGSVDDPQTAHQPVPCMQCENAPCENVCPVAATVHSQDGLNDMAYNRCVGTRYCANNCPYKVRRFNFLDWRHYYERDENDDVLPVARLKYNPDVTLRSRGVMEKCTYCVQRIRGAERDAKLRGQDRVADGVIVPACAQACPVDAIVFGDIMDPNSRVSQVKKSQRNYTMLAELNVKPRTSYLARIRNQNPELRDHE